MGPSNAVLKQPILFIHNFNFSLKDLTDTCFLSENLKSMVVLPISISNLVFLSLVVLLVFSNLCHLYPCSYTSWSYIYIYIYIYI